MQHSLRTVTTGHRTTPAQVSRDKDSLNSCRVPRFCRGIVLCSVVSSEKESPHGRLDLSQLEPYKNYNCTGTFTHDLLKTVTKTDIDVRTDCSRCQWGASGCVTWPQQTDAFFCVLTELQLNNIGNSTTSSSVDLSWSLSSSVCEGPLTFTYMCSCSPHRQGDNHILGEKTGENSAAAPAPISLPLLTWGPQITQTKLITKETMLVSVCVCFMALFFGLCCVFFVMRCFPVAVAN